MDILINLGFTLLLLAAGYGWGTRAEKKHYRSIIAREKAATDIVVLAAKRAPDGITGSAELVRGNVVIASDYFKRFVAWLIGIFGGRINVYESLIDRARREALLRLKEEARQHGANMIVNVKFETATLNDFRKGQTAMVEVLAYGSAVHFPDQAQS